MLPTVDRLFAFTRVYEVPSIVSEPVGLPDDVPVDDVPVNCTLPVNPEDVKGKSNIPVSVE